MSTKKIASEKPVKKTVSKPARKTVRKKTAVTPKTELQSTEIIPKSGPIGVQLLIQQSWTVFKGTILSYLKLVGVGIGLLITIAVVGLLLALPLMISSGGSAFELLSSPTPLQIIGIILVIVWALASFLATCAYFIFLPLASVFILENKNASLDYLFKKTKRMLLPYLGISLVSGLLIFGSWMVFVIPGILVSLLFIFMTYIFVIEGKRGLAVLRRSYELVRAHFWEVLLRVLLIQAALYLGSYVFDSMAERSDVFGLVSFVFSVAGGWFAQSYMYLIYKNLKSRVPGKNSANLTWIVVVSVIGWLIFFGLIAALVNGALQIPDLQESVNAFESEAGTL